MRAIVTADGSLALGTKIFRAALGYGGVRVDKREGDGATPAGVLALRTVLFRQDRRPAPVCLAPVRPIAPEDGWCDDPTHLAYNRLVRLPISASAETLWRDDAVYDIIAVLGWNAEPILPGRGSAIFLHIARPDYAPTEGCIALAPNDLLDVLASELTEIVVTA